MIKRKHEEKYRHKASLTVEASLVIPIFLTAIMTFMFFFQMISFQLYFYQVIAKTAQEAAQYGYIVQTLNKNEKSEVTEDDDTESENLEGALTDEGERDISIINLLIEKFDIEGLIADEVDSVMIQSLVYLHTDQEKVKKSGIVNEWAGISFWGSTLNNEDGCIIIEASYKIKIPFFPEIIPAFPVTQRIKVKNFSGYLPPEANDTETDESGENEDAEYVYVAENGSVYHTDSQCTYLTINTMEVPFADIGNLYNYSKESYAPCDKCIEEGYEYNTVFITKSGNRYHATVNCSAIRRTYNKVLLSEINGLPLCSRCKANSEITEE